MTEPRRRKILALLRQPLFHDHWREVIGKIAASDFCNGRGDSSFRADFDFLLNPEKFARALEGSYDNANARAGPFRLQSQTDILSELQAFSGGLGP